MAIPAQPLRGSQAATLLALPQMPATMGTSLPQGAMPPATEEEWLFRASKRANVVEYHKATSQGYQHLVQTGRRRPVTPDPSDRNLSKRNWEQKMREWKEALTPS